MQRESSFFEDYYRKYWQRSDIISSKQRKYAAERAMIAASLLPIRRGKVLDVGCGEGFLVQYLTEKKFKVYGMDVSAKAVEIGAKKGFKMKMGDIQKGVPFKDKFDAIFCLEVLEHLVDPVRAVENMRKSLKPGGCLILSVPNEFHILRRLCILFGIVDFSSPGWHHLRFFTIASFRKMLKNCNLKIVEASFIPLYSIHFHSALRFLLFLVTSKIPSLLATTQLYLCTVKHG